MSSSQNKQQLRAAAEARLPAPPEETRPAANLLHELQVHQIELEMQNEALRQAQNALEASRDRYVDLYELAPLGYLTLAPDGLIKQINLTGTTLLGLERKDLLQKRFAEFINPQDRDRWSRLFQQAKRIFGKTNVELMMQRSDGTIFHARIDVIVHAEECDALVTLTDISERISIELRLKESEERWRFAIEGHGDALWDWDVTAGTIYRSIRYLLLLGTSDTPTICSVAESETSIHPEDRAVIRETNRRLLYGTTSEELGECRLQRQDGETIWISYRCHVMRRDAAGRAERVIGTMRDISQRKQRQRQMDVQIGKLSHQARLLALGEMASATAHEINQPLTAIASYAAACARQLSDRPSALDIVQRIEQQALRAGQIVWRMRDFAKLRNTERQAVRMYALVADVFEWLSWDHRSNSIELSSTIPADFPALQIDRVQIEQVLLNLIWNGIQAMADLPARATIKLGATLDAARKEAIISVADRGCGLPDQIALDIFAPFASNKRDGLGLGLSISRSIIEQHQGRLWSAPRAGGGSIFSFSLPLAEAPLPPASDPLPAIED
jgi:PAS domain S-box-containing protein